MELINSIAAMFKQIANEPACLFVVLGINVILFMWEAIPQLPSRLVVVVGPILGAFTYPLFATTASVPYDVPNPKAVLVVNGLVSGLLAIAIHTAVIALLRKTFGWPPEPTKQQPPADPENKP